MNVNSVVDETRNRSHPLNAEAVGVWRFCFQAGRSDQSDARGTTITHRLHARPGTGNLTCFYGSGLDQVQYQSSFPNESLDNAADDDESEGYAEDDAIDHGAKGDDAVDDGSVDDDAAQDDDDAAEPDTAENYAETEAVDDDDSSEANDDSTDENHEDDNDSDAKDDAAQDDDAAEPDAETEHADDDDASEGNDDSSDEDYEDDDSDAEDDVPDGDFADDDDEEMSRESAAAFDSTDDDEEKVQARRAPGVPLLSRLPPNFPVRLKGDLDTATFLSTSFAAIVWFIRSFAIFELNTLLQRTKANKHSKFRVCANTNINFQTIFCGQSAKSIPLEAYPNILLGQIIQHVPFSIHLYFVGNGAAYKSNFFTNEQLQVLAAVMNASVRLVAKTGLTDDPNDLIAQAAYKEEMEFMSFVADDGTKSSKSELKNVKKQLSGTTGKLFLTAMSNILKEIRDKPPEQWSLPYNVAAFVLSGVKRSDLLDTTFRAIASDLFECSVIVAESAGTKHSGLTKYYATVLKASEVDTINLWMQDVVEKCQEEFEQKMFPSLSEGTVSYPSQCWHRLDYAFQLFPSSNHLSFIPYLKESQQFTRICSSITKSAAHATLEDLVSSAANGNVMRATVRELRSDDLLFVNGDDEQSDNRDILHESENESLTSESTSAVEIDAEEEQNFDQEFVTNVENTFAAAFPFVVRNTNTTEVDDDDPHQIVDDDDVEDPYAAVLQLVDSISSITGISKYDMLLTDNIVGNIHTGRIPLSFVLVLPDDASDDNNDDDNLPRGRMELVPCNANRAICGMQLYSPYVRNVFMLPQRERLYNSLSQLPTLLSYVLAYGQLVEMKPENLYPMTTHIWDIYQSLQLTLLLVQDRIRELRDGPVRMECSFMMNGRGPPLWPTANGLSVMDCIAVVENEGLMKYFDNVFLHLLDPFNPLFHLSVCAREEVKTPSFIQKLLSLNAPYKATLIYHAELIAQAFCNRCRKGLVLNSISLRYPDSSLYRLDASAFYSDEECMRFNEIGIRMLNPGIVPLTNYEASSTVRAQRPSQAFRAHLLASACSNSVRCPGPFVSFLTDLIEIFHRFACGSCADPRGGTYNWNPQETIEVSLLHEINYNVLSQLTHRSRKHLIREICKRLTELYQEVMKWTLWNRAGRSGSQNRLGWTLETGPPTHTGQLHDCASRVSGTCLMKQPEDKGIKDNVIRDADVFAIFLFGEFYSTELTVEMAQNRRKSKRSWDRCPVRKAASIVVSQLEICRKACANQRPLVSPGLSIPTSQSQEKDWTVEEFEMFFMKEFCKNRRGRASNHRPIVWHTTPSDQLKDPWLSHLVEVREPIPIALTSRPIEQLFPHSNQSPRKGKARSSSRPPSRAKRLRTTGRAKTLSPIDQPWYWNVDTGKQMDEFWRLFTGGNTSQINKVIYGRVLLSFYIQQSQFDAEWKPIHYTVNLADFIQIDIPLVAGYPLGFFYFDQTRARKAVKNVANSLFLGSIENPRLFHGVNIRDLDQIMSWLLQEVPLRRPKDLPAYRRAATAWRTILLAFSNSLWQDYLNSTPRAGDGFPTHLHFYDPDERAPKAIDLAIEVAGTSLDADDLRLVGKRVNETGCLTEKLFKFLVMHRALYCMYFLPSSPRRHQYYELAKNNRENKEEELPDHPKYSELPIRFNRH